MARGNGRQLIYLDDEHRPLFLSMLVVGRFARMGHAYGLMQGRRARIALLASLLLAA